MKLVEQHYKRKAKKISHFYGLTIDLEDWWFILRESQTEEVIKLIVESISKGLLDKKIEEIKSLIKWLEICYYY